MRGTEHIPEIFESPATNIRTVLPERTFWEKITILHHEANRPETSIMPARYARHYYDVYCIGHSEYKEKAFEQPELLERVVRFKMKFYPRGWAHYENAKPGSLKLVPPAYRIDALRKDYSSMRQMFFGKAPEFDELIKYIESLEAEINETSLIPH